MGLQLLEREKRVFAGEAEFKPAFEGHEYLLERQLKPEARKDIVAELDKAGIVPTAMMDISDGSPPNYCTSVRRVMWAAVYMKTGYRSITRRQLWRRNLI